MLLEKHVTPFKKKIEMKLQRFFLKTKRWNLLNDCHLAVLKEINLNSISLLKDKVHVSFDKNFRNRQ